MLVYATSEAERNEQAGTCVRYASYGEREPGGGPASFVSGALTNPKEIPRRD